MKNGHGFARLIRDMPHVLSRHEMHGHGHGRGWNPHVNMRAASVVFIDVDADHAFPHGVSTRKDDCGAKSESCFRK